MSDQSPFVLLPYQQKWLADRANVKIWEKSRRIGATWCEAAGNVLEASEKKKAQDVWFISYNEDGAREYIRDAANWAKQFNQIASDIDEEIIHDERKDIKAFGITFATGKRITALSSRPTNLRGKQGIAVLDEFAFHDDPQGLVKAALAFLMWGGKCRIMSTHNGVTSHFYELIEETRKGKKPYSLHRVTVDDALEQGLYKRICLKQGIEWSPEAEKVWRDDIIAQYGQGADEELFCIPNESGGCYFPRLLVEQNMSKDVPVLRLSFKDNFNLRQEAERRGEVECWLKETMKPHLDKLEPHFKSSYGMDFGRSGDLSYLIVGQEQPNLVRKAAFALEMRNVPFAQQEQILIYIVDRLPRFTGGANDARGNGQSLAEKLADKYGKFRIKEVKATANWYLENFPKYKAGLEDKQVVLPVCSDLLDDHRAVELVGGVPKVPDNKRTKDSKGGQRHGDGAIACVLWWFASLNQDLGYPALGSMGFDDW